MSYKGNEMKHSNWSVRTNKRTTERERSETGNQFSSFALKSHSFKLIHLRPAHHYCLFPCHSSETFNQPSTWERCLNLLCGVSTLSGTTMSSQQCFFLVYSHPPAECSLLNKAPPTPTMYKYRPTYSPGKNHTALTHAYANQVMHTNTQELQPGDIQGQ